MESTQRSSGLRARTQSARLGRAPNLFGAGMNLGPLRPPPAAARIYQIHVSPLFPLAPLVRLAFPDLFGRGRPVWRAGERRARRLGAPRHYNSAPSSVIAYGDATFPPVGGRLGEHILQASPLRGEVVERSETDEGG